MSSTLVLLASTPMPLIGPSCVAMITTPAPERKPLITGSDRNLTRNPSRPSPMTRWNTPTSTAIVADSATNSAVPSGASLATPAADSTEIVASGPMPSWPTRPRTAYTSSGTTDA